MDSGPGADRFRSLCAAIEPGLRRSLVAAYGVQVGRDATCEALAWAWQHLDRVEAMANPGGYLYRVGQSAARKELRSIRSSTPWPAVQAAAERHFEPALAGAMERLTPSQRTAVLLVHGHGYTLSEAAEHMGCRKRTLRNHLERGMGKLRTDLGVLCDDDRI